MSDRKIEVGERVKQFPNQIRCRLRGETLRWTDEDVLVVLESRVEKCTFNVNRVDMTT